MSTLPFSADDFFGVFAAYNQTVWPAPLVLTALALGIAWLAFRPTPWSTRVVWYGLAVLWLWTGIVYYLLYFRAISPAAYLFGGMFLIQALLFVQTARQRRTFAISSDASGSVGAFFIIYALLLYPDVAMIAGGRYPAVPTFGAPCPVTIYTFGLLLWTQERPPLQLLIIPTIWALIGSTPLLHSASSKTRSCRLPQSPLRDCCTGARVSRWKRRLRAYKGRSC